MSFGRTKIYSDAKEITAANIQIVNEVLKNKKATRQSILITAFYARLGSESLKARHEKPCKQ